MAEIETTANHLVPQKDAAAAPLTVRAELLPERAYTTQKVTDPLPPALIERVGQLVVDEKQKEILLAPVPDDEIDIRYDGFIYVSHEFCRRKLFEAFGPMGWSMVEVSPLAPFPGTDEWYQKWCMLIGGVYVGVALSSMEWIKNNAKLDLGQVYEIIQSDCVRRICGKTLGIGIEAWNKRVQKEWRDKHAIRVLTQDWRGDKRIQWRRPDADPFVDGKSGKNIEIMAPYVDPPQADEKAKGTPTKQQATPPPPPATETKPAAPKPAPPAVPPKPPAVNEMKILPAQLRMLMARARNAGLFIEDDAGPAIDWAASELDLDPPESTKADDLFHMLEQLPGKRVTEAAKKLDQLIAQAKEEAK